MTDVTKSGSFDNDLEVLSGIVGSVFDYVTVLISVVFIVFIVSLLHFLHGVSVITIDIDREVVISLYGMFLRFT